MRRKTGAEANGASRDRLPRAPSPLVERTALLDRLDRIVEHSLTCVTAPAGYGKSVLVAQWCRERCGLPVRWLSLRRESSAAIDTLMATLGELAGDSSPAPVGSSGDAHTRLDGAGRQWLEAVLNVIAESVLVIDGVDDPDLVGYLADLALVLERSASRLHVVVTGRCTPPPELVALRLRGAVMHVDTADLELDAAGVAAVVAAYSSPVGDDVAEQLASRLDGWMTGAVLVGLAHSGEPGCDADALLAAAFDDVDAYVTAEVLGSLPPEIRRFVMLSACLDEVDPALSDIMTGRDDSERQLGLLRVSGFPIRRVAAPPSPFQFLRPVREVLEAHARRELAAERTAAVRAAAEWYSDRRRPFEAAECWVRLGEWEQVITVVRLHLQQILEDEELHRLAELVSNAPPALLRQHVGLALAGAWVLRMEGRIGAASELLSIYEPFMSDAGRMIADVSRSGFASWVEDVDGALGFAEAAIAACDEVGDEAFTDAPDRTPFYTEHTTDTYRTLARGNALLASCYASAWERGAPHLDDIGPDTAAILPQLSIVQWHGCRATYLALAGRAREALSDARSGLAVASDSDLIDHRSAADVHYALGEAHRLTVDHDRAATALEQSRELAELNGRRNLLTAVVASRAHLLVDAGEPQAALDLVDDHRGSSPQRAPRTLAAMLAAAEARALAASGDHRPALRRLELAPATPCVVQSRVSISLAVGDLAGARSAVERWPNEHTVDSTVRRALAAAVVLDTAGVKGAADDSFRAALSAAADHQLAQPFVELGPLASKLVARARAVVSGTAELELVQHVQGLMARGLIAAIAPRFTPRESVVLAHLAEGRSLAEIAGEIHLSVNTVKTHVKAIYRKLGVGSRVEAVNAWKASTAPRSDR